MQRDGKKITFVRLCKWNVSENPGDEFHVSVLEWSPGESKLFEEQEAQLWNAVFGRIFGAGQSRWPQVFNQPRHGRCAPCLPCCSLFRKLRGKSEKKHPHCDTNLVI